MLPFCVPVGNTWVINPLTEPMNPLHHKQRAFSSNTLTQCHSFPSVCQSVTALTYGLHATSSSTVAQTEVNKTQCTTNTVTGPVNAQCNMANYLLILP